MKGEFLNQIDSDQLVLDPDFGFSLLTSVDLADFDLLQSASLRLPEGKSIDLDDFGDTWTILETYETKEALDAAFEWGDYIVQFQPARGDKYSCLLSFPETELPPRAMLENFPDVQAVDPGKSLPLSWVFDAAPRADDFVQVYINLGHSEVFATPNPGEPGALNGAARSVTVPAGTFEAGWVYELNIEITRTVSFNSDCYPGADGAAALFRSTSIDLSTVIPIVLRVLSLPKGGVISIEVAADATRPVVLQASEDIRSWSNVATNLSPSATSAFSLAVPATGARFFRAWQP